ncbi:MAG: tetratricopeptide repeat protein, partial [Flavobacteriales bacterium]|nr:tetratricopeptide repeat protein [Flavobacteriales bacterium]
FNRGTIYDQEGDIANAEKDYLKALDLNPTAFGANYNLGALYFNSGVETNNKANGTSNNTVYAKLKKQADAAFAKALPYLETAHELDTEDKNTLLSLKQLYYLNNDYAKSEEMKKLIAELKK